ncbi:MAG: S8 family serine peptidase [Candidatus Baltobacteraceae bacterium]
MAALALAACSSPTSLNLPIAPSGSTQWQAQGRAQRVCPRARLGEGQCAALIMSRPVGRGNTGPLGWAPAQIQAAYHLPSSTKGGGQIVAIVDAYDNPHVASDLATYRAYYGLPSANFSKFNQKGVQGKYPTHDPGWGYEIDLDVEMVSAACPNCTIYLVEASSESKRNLEDAEVVAARLGAHVVSNSWGCYVTGCTWSARAFKHPGVTYVAAAGDDGYGSYPPAHFANVVSVGGTVLSQSGSSYSEVVWSATGGGCAPAIAKPSWQTDPSCPGRTSNDVSAVATGIAEYDSYRYAGWSEAEGTSASTPLIAAIFALAGNASQQQGGKTFWTLSQSQRQNDLHYIGSGTANNCPPSLSGTYLCSAGTNEFGTYSGPAGWGTPNGIGAF